MIVVGETKACAHQHCVHQMHAYVTRGAHILEVVILGYDQSD